MDQPSKLATFVNLIINVKLDTPLKYILEMMKKKKVNIAAVYDDADFKGIITLKIFLKKSLAILKMNIINTTVYTDPIIEI